METRAAGDRRAGDYRHEAFLYADPAHYLASTVPFIRDGLAGGSPVLVAVPASRLSVLEAHVPVDDPLLTLLPTESVGRNPARLIPVWAEFLDHWFGYSTRGVGEPDWAGRTPDEAVEWELHEALLNRAFEPAPEFWLRCPYDTAALDADALGAARRSHPHVATSTGSGPSDAYDTSGDGRQVPLPRPPHGAESFPLGADSLRTVRRHARDVAVAAGLTAERSGEFEIAVSEATTNAVLHGAGASEVSFWRQGDRLICEVRDHGGGDIDALSGRRRPPSDRPSGRGLWILNQLCDLVQIRCDRVGTTVRLHVVV